MSRRDGPGAPTVFIVDDDPDLRAALAGLFRSVDLATTDYASAAEFLNAARPDGPGCLVLDVRMPGLSGLDSQAQLAGLGIPLPVVLMTGHGGHPDVDAGDEGRRRRLPDQAVPRPGHAGRRRGRARPRRRAARPRLGAGGRADGLQDADRARTAREREVFAYVTAGLMNKQIAGRLDLSEITVKIHRGHVMRKMAARSLADLVRMARALGTAPD